MRWIIYGELKEPILPLDYRCGFISLIKKIFEKANPLLYQKLYEHKNKIKPFTFSVFFPELKKNDQQKVIHTGHKVLINFSSFSSAIHVNFYNGILNLKRDNFYPLFDNQLWIQKIHLKPLFRIRNHVCIFRTMSPVLINSKGDKRNYLTPEEPAFNSALQFITGEMAREFLGNEYEFEFENLQTQKKVITHYQASLTSFTGIFRIKSHPELLQLIYDIGLGVRRSQGFGMLEVIQ